MLYKCLMDWAPRDGVSVERRGGSNGTADDGIDMSALRQFLHYPGSTPRQSRAVVWVPMQLSFHAFYITPYQQGRTAAMAPYALPVIASQIELSPNKMLQANESVRSALFNIIFCCVECKIGTSALIESLNNIVESKGWMSFVDAKDRRNMKLHDRRCIVREAVMVQNETNHIIASQHEAEDIAGLYLHHGTTTKLSVVAAALKNHTDNTREHQSVSVKRFSSFFEPKMLFVATDRSHNPEKHPNMPALGRGGAGPGKFAFVGKLSAYQ